MILIRNFLVDENPKLIREWDYEKNGKLRPDDFTVGSEQKIWWKCELGHSWEAMICNRTHGTNCPYCAGKKVWAGFNDLASTYPHLACEWHYNENGDLRPEDITAASNKKVWWLCPLGHTWIASINNRKHGNGCPYCAGKMIWLGFNDLSTVQPRISSEWDFEKNENLHPKQFTAGSSKKVWWKCEHGHSWRTTIHSRQKNGCPHCYGNIFTPGVNDLLTVNPMIAAEWDSEKNGDLRPDNVAANNPAKVWWLCKLGHSWNAKISNRNHGAGCPYCTNRKVLKGFNDLLHVDPKLCEEWDCEGNISIQPDEVTIGSGKKVFWKCEKGHSYTARIPDRKKGNGCPVCAGKIVIAGENDLKTLRPDIASEWDRGKNADLLPDHVTVQSTSKVWWRCKKGHSYLTQVYNRFNGTDCPYCAGNLPIPGETDLATVHPELLAEWDYEKNKSKSPEQYTSRSNKKVWWICKEGHSWQSTIDDRHLGSDCPYCSGRLAISGVTDAATLFPELIKEWDDARNQKQGLSLQHLLPNSAKRCWWKCKRGHHWKTTVQSRVFGSGCPFCKGMTPAKTRLVK